MFFPGSIANHHSLSFITGKGVGSSFKVDIRSGVGVRILVLVLVVVMVVVVVVGGSQVWRRRWERAA